MHKLMPLMVFMGLALVSFASATPAHAQAPRTWVSRVGNDSNPCSTTAPCRTFAAAIANNGTGVRAGGGAVIRLSNDNIAFNRTGIAGATTSFGNNRISGNTAAGTAPTAAGAISTEFGQQ